MIRPSHSDVRNPSLRIVLFAQEPPRYQGVLFVSTAIEPRTEPPCDHFASMPQARFDGGFDEVCASCGARV